MIGDAWLLQYRGIGPVSLAIQLATGSVHSHTALTQRVGEREIDVLELREFVGGRRRTLQWHAAQNPGRIDVFQPNAGGKWNKEWNAIETASMMRMLCDQDYGYWGIAKLILRRVPVIHRLMPSANFETIIGHEQPFCSHAAAMAYVAGGVDPVPNLPSDRVTPGRLTTSLFFEYAFTIGKDE